MSPPATLPAIPSAASTIISTRSRRRSTRADLRDALVIGVWYGGPVAAEFAARHPGRVRGLVLVSALPFGWHPDERARFYLRAPRLLSPLFCIALTAPDGAGIEERNPGAGTARALERGQRASRRPCVHVADAHGATHSLD